jgi:hypothetical protein
LGGKYLLSALQKASNLINNSDFENGVIKIQTGLENTLTRLEKAAVAILLKAEYDGVEEKDGEDTGCELSYAESILSERLFS